MKKIIITIACALFVSTAANAYTTTTFQIQHSTGPAIHYVQPTHHTHHARHMHRHHHAQPVVAHHNQHHHHHHNTARDIIVPLAITLAMVL